MEKEIFETEYGIADMVRERQNQYRETYTRSNIAGCCICIFSVVPLFSSLFLTESELVYCAALSVMILLVGIGTTVSYTHLDVYKRQRTDCLSLRMGTGF